MDTRKPTKTDVVPRIPALFEGTFNLPMFRRLGREIDFLFDRFGLERTVFEPAETVWTPDVEMFRRDNAIVVRADVPGMTKNDLTIEVTDGQLLLRGERKQEKEEKKEGYYRAERTFGAFYRTLPLPDGVNMDEAKATIKDGVLEVTIPAPPKIEEKKRTLAIEEPAPVKTVKAA
jgi:HSP20 family molecular chaperone IbpA